MLSHGLAMFCYDSEFSYSDLCNFNIAQIKKFLTDNITVYTDSDTAKNIKDTSIHVRITEKPKGNQRVFGNKNRWIDWHNTNRISILENPPYEKTVVIDTDYFIYSDRVKTLFDSSYDFLCYNNSKELSGTYKADKEKIGETGIPFCWATVMLVTRSKFCKDLFKMMNHIKQHYNYYCGLFRINSSVFRNDFVLSIALHYLNGRYKTNKTIPGSLICLNDTAEVFLSDDKIRYKYEENNQIFEQQIKNLDVHILNKEVHFE